MNSFLYNIINTLFNIVEISIFIECILSWVPNIRENSLTDILHSINEPFLKPGRFIQSKILPDMMIDFSPIIALLVISFIKRILFAVI
ncbi:MAG: YggT family protein [Bacillota bacterium]|nr:YggT family protein [Bacillota bacterium]